MSSWIKFSLFRKKGRNSNPFTRKWVNKIHMPAIPHRIVSRVREREQGGKHENKEI